jgi:DNA-3-methyladenine glycosylase
MRKNRKAVSAKKLDLPFFNRHVVDVARDLVGKTLVVGAHRGMITETEAYRGADDPASHAFRGPTPRAQIMFGPPGFVYVYFIYGMYHCLNIVTEPEGQPSAVLIRGLRLLNGSALHLNGPGKICRHLGIDRSHNGIQVAENSTFYFEEGEPVGTLQTTSRIGIRQGNEHLWRFVMPSELGLRGRKIPSSPQNIEQ